MGDGPLYFENVEMGDELGPVERVVTELQVRDFLRLMGVAHDPSFFQNARAAAPVGPPGPIVPGPMNIAILSQLLTGWSSTVTLKKLDVVFRQVALQNSLLRLKGVVTDKHIADGEPRLECDVSIEGDRGAKLAIGKATVSLPSRHP